MIGKSLISLVSVSLLLVFVAHTPKLRWRERAPLPRPRAGYMAGVIGGRLIVAGGTYWENKRKLWTARTDVFDPKANVWQESASLPESRSDAACVALGDALYVFGGGANGEVRRDALVFQESQWKPIPEAELPEPRLYAVAVSYLDSIYLLGGLSKDGDSSTVSNRLWVWNRKSRRSGWEDLPSLPGPRRIGHAVAESGGKIYVFGGTNTDRLETAKNFDDAYRFDPQNQKWTRLRNLPIGRRDWWAVGLRDRILLLGGYTNTYEKDVFEYELQSGLYHQIGVLPQRLGDAKFFNIGDLVIGAGGEAALRIRAQWTFQAQLPEGWGEGRASEVQ